MKRILFCISVLVLPLMMSAQEKGDMYLSGSLGISGGNVNSSSTAGNSTTSRQTPSTLEFNLAPRFGYFVAKNLDVHLSLGYGLTRTFNSFDAENNKLFTRRNVFTITPGVSYHIPLTEKLYYVPGLDLGIGFGGISKDIALNKIGKSGLTEVELSLSLLSFEYRIGNHIGIMFSAGEFGYHFSAEKKTDVQGNTSTTTSTKTNAVSLGLNLSTEIALKYYF